MMRKRIPIPLLVHENVRQAALEDFEDRFHTMAQQNNTLRAYLWFWGQVLCFIPGNLQRKKQELWPEGVAQILSLKDA